MIKFVAPLCWFFAERAAGRPIAQPPILWDFWWVAHLALARLLWVRHRWAWSAGVAVAGIEVGIVAVKLAIWLAHPDLSFWRLLWLTNKLYVLAFFLLLLGLSEHIAFRIAYAIAAAACILLQGFYLSAVLKSVGRGASFAAHPRMKHPRARWWALPERDDGFVGFRTCAL